MLGGLRTTNAVSTQTQQEKMVQDGLDLWLG